jgi:hypothetical protein
MKIPEVQEVVPSNLSQHSVSERELSVPPQFRPPITVTNAETQNFELKRFTLHP